MQTIQCFYFKQKEHVIVCLKRIIFFIFIYIVYIISIFTLFKGRHRTHWVQRHATLALLLHSTVGWLAGIVSSRQATAGTEMRMSPSHHLFTLGQGQESGSIGKHEN